MPVEAHTAALLAQIADLDGPKIHESTVADARQMMVASLPDVPQVPVARVEDRTIEGPRGAIALRLYWPEHSDDSSSGPLALHVFFHGGGWVVGNLDTHDEICRELCSGAGLLVVSVDYRLAPEHPFPAGLEDCYAAVCWASSHATELGARSDAVSIGGDSAGANLAAAVAIMARDRKGPELAFQLLAYPVTDQAMDTASYRDYADGYLLSRDLMDWFWSHYCPQPSDRTDPLASVLKAPNLNGLPSALIMTAQYDPLRDEGEAYGERLKGAGVGVQLHRLDGLIHGFLSQVGYIKAARSALRVAVDTLREAHEGFI